jgi:NAD/NADP transhydrogenase alpha subunit
MSVEQHALETIAGRAQPARRMYILAAVAVLVAAAVNLFAGVLAATLVAVFAKSFARKVRFTYGAIAVILLFAATLFTQRPW